MATSVIWSGCDNGTSSDHPCTGRWLGEFEVTRSHGKPVEVVRNLELSVTGPICVEVILGDGVDKHTVPTSAEVLVDVNGQQSLVLHPGDLTGKHMTKGYVEVLADGISNVGVAAKLKSEPGAILRVRAFDGDVGQPPELPEDIPDNASTVLVRPTNEGVIQGTYYRLEWSKGSVSEDLVIWCAEDPDDPGRTNCGPDGTQFERPLDIAIVHDGPLEVRDQLPTILHDGQPISTVMSEDWLAATVSHFTSFTWAPNDWSALPFGRLQHPEKQIEQGESDYYFFWKVPRTVHVVCAADVNGNVSISGKWFLPWLIPQYDSSLDEGEDCIRFPVTQAGYYFVKVEGVEDSSYRFNIFTASISEPMDIWHPCMDCGYSGPYDRDWLGDGTNHLGKDYPANVGDTVRAIADGRVYRVDDSVGGFGGAEPAKDGPMLVIEHEKSNGTHFYALYGHVETWLQEGDIVGGGQGVGFVQPYLVYEGEAQEDWPHLHFGIWDSPDNFPTSVLGYGSVRDFVNPVPFLAENDYLYWPVP
jgi:murein DD-endopeptidase MepM/ murein hydrolase activator NlpD